MSSLKDLVMVVVLLSEIELRNLIANEKERNTMIMDPLGRERHRNFILGLECALNE